MTFNNIPSFLDNKMKKLTKKYKTKGSDNSECMIEEYDCDYIIKK